MSQNKYFATRQTGFAKYNKTNSMCDAGAELHSPRRAHRWTLSMVAASFFAWTGAGRRNFF